MEDYMENIATKLYALMETSGPPQTAFALGQELRLEFPDDFREFSVNYAAKYSLCGCGQHHAYLNGLLTILDQWAETGKVRKTVENGSIYWQKTDPVNR